MGCSVSTKFKKPAEGESKTVKEIVLKPGAFVQENENKFSDVYRLGKVIGTGTYGEVRLCYHRESNCKRAVKIIRKDLMTNEIMRTNLEKESSEECVGKLNSEINSKYLGKKCFTSSILVFSGFALSL